MRSWAVVILSCIALGLAGCGYYRWQKQGATDADFKADQAACSQPGSSALTFNSCMQQRGWTYLD